MVLGGEQRGEMDLRQGRQETLAAGEYRQGREAFEELRLVGEGSRGHESRVGREMVIGELPKQQQGGAGEEGSTMGRSRLGLARRSRPRAGLATSR